MTVPLLFGGEVLGILDVQSDQPTAFSNDDRFLFETLADNIAIAMRNASLYRSELWRRQVADSLREVAGLLSADVDLEQVLRAILLELERTLPLDLAAIWLLDEELEDSLDTLPVLRLAAVRGSEAAHLELEIGSTPRGVLESNVSEVEELPIEQSDAWLLSTLDAAEPVIRRPATLFEPLGAALDYPSDYSLIAAPLRAGAQRLGVLTLAHRSSRRYGSEARAMTAAFASYAAVAIENTRLYETAHEQAWVSTVLLQVADATQAVTELEQLLETVSRITPMLTGVKACLLYLLDEDSRFTPATAAGLTAEQLAEFHRWQFTPGDSPSLDQLMTHKTPVILGMDESDAILQGILRGDPQLEPDKAALPQEGFLVLTPLLAHGDVLGAFLIDYSTIQLGTSPALALEKFFDERLPIIQGIAHQTAMAVENIRLLRAQKEEAYVSVALLQVAQAVVSANDLEEALGAIVRITPILAGVQRALIYIWDGDYAVFRLAQAYGLSRTAESKPYRMAEFPMLEAIWIQDGLLAYPLQHEIPELGEPPEIWSYLIPPDLDEVEHYLAEHDRLLLGFPLSVKGDVLGVLLVEEPENGQGDGRSSPNRRLRAKRMEIITGISQQAALAIQNDHLQREMVDRERLEREMQLAREIQQAFLPQSLPEFPGWELQVYWRTAREVGGDFYDVFELPGGELGLVIADVADKGMPAALYMTLVRTLVRATVESAASPGEALEHVNNILVPDAPQGMFVTLAYTMLSIADGEFKLANAGHNPPLVLRSSTGKLEKVEKTGMALGVMEDTSIASQALSLGAGDFLIFYTDGITEAFAPNGDIYGEERLFEAILELVRDGDSSATKQVSAQEMLDAIDASVTAFLDDQPPSDDLTLLVLKRAGKAAPLA
jgi:serine phosphatase RsbU (regulator of sigma subunit)